MGCTIEVHGNNVEAALVRLRKATKDVRDKEREKEFFKKPSAIKREAEIKSKRKQKNRRRREESDD